MRAGGVCYKFTLSLCIALSLGTCLRDDIAAYQPNTHRPYILNIPIQQGTTLCYSSAYRQTAALTLIVCTPLLMYIQSTPSLNPKPYITGLPLSTLRGIGTLYYSSFSVR